MRRASAAEGSCVHSHLVQTFGEGQHLTQLLAGGSRIPSYCTGAGKHPGRAPTERNPEHTYDGCHFYLNGEATLRFVGERMPALLDQLQPGLSSALGDIQWVVPHQVHAPPWACRACARVGTPAPDVAEQPKPKAGSREGGVSRSSPSAFAVAWRARLPDAVCPYL